MEPSQRDVEEAVGDRETNVHHQERVHSSRGTTLKPPKGSYERYFGAQGRRQLPADRVDSLMTDVEMKAARQQAWWRIAHSFAGARTAPGRRATPGYILGVANRLSDLARHIVGGMSTEAKDEIFAASRLPEDYKIHIKGTPTEVAERVIYEVVMRELVDLRDRHELYFLEEGEWRILSSALAEYHRLVRQTIPNPEGRGDYRRGSSRPRFTRRLPRVVRRELLAVV